MVRLVETVEFEGPGGEVEMTGSTSSRQPPGTVAAVRPGHIEHRLFIDHNAPETAAEWTTAAPCRAKGAHSVWVGDVLIRKVAEDIDTYESNRNLVLTDGCRADSVPNLEIETGEIQAPVTPRRPGASTMSRCST